MASRPEKAESIEEACRQLARRRTAGPAEDAAQDACVKALQMADPDAVREPLRYVMRIARNLFVDHRRRAGREARLFEYSENAAQAAGDVLDPERILAGKQALNGVMAAIQALPPRCRQAFHLHRFEHQSYAAIATSMNISISMVEKHIAEAMSRLSRDLHKDGMP